MLVLGALALGRYLTGDVTETYLRVGLGLLAGGAGWLFARGVLVRPTDRLVVDRTADESRPPDAAERFTLPPSRFTLPPGLLDAASDAETPQAAHAVETQTPSQLTTMQLEAMTSAPSTPHDLGMPTSAAAPPVEASHSARLVAPRDVAPAAEPPEDESTLIAPVDESLGAPADASSVVAPADESSVAPAADDESLVAPADESTLVAAVDESLVAAEDESTLVAPVDEDLDAT